MFPCVSSEPTATAVQPSITSIATTMTPSRVRFTDLLPLTTPTPTSTLDRGLQGGQDPTWASDANGVTGHITRPERAARRSARDTSPRNSRCHSRRTEGLVLPLGQGVELLAGHELHPVLLSSARNTPSGRRRRECRPARRPALARAVRIPYTVAA